MPSNEFIFDLAKNSSRLAERATDSVGLKFAKETVNKIPVVYPQGEVYEVIAVNSNGTYNLSKYSAYSYTYSPGGLGDSEPAGGDLYLPNGMGTRFGAKLDSVVSILPGKSNTLQRGDMVEVGFYDRNRQRPYIKRILKRGAYMHETDVVVPITKIANELWTQSEACLRKDNVGVFLAGTTYGGADMASPPSTYQVMQTINYPVADLAHGINEGLYPHGLVYYNGIRIVVKQLYTANAVQGYEVYFQDLTTEYPMIFADTAAPLTPLTFIDFPDVVNMGAGVTSFRYKTPSNIIYLNDERKGYIHILPQYLSAGASFKILSIDLTRLKTEGLITKKISTLTGVGVRASEISIVDKTMIQTWYSGFKMWKTTDYLNWTEFLNISNWVTFRTDNPDYSVLTSNGFTLTSALINSSIARFRTQLDTDPITWQYSNFVLGNMVEDITEAKGGAPGSLVGKAQLTGARLINLEITDMGLPGTPHDAVVSEPLALNGTDSRITELTNIITAYDQAISIYLGFVDSETNYPNYSVVGNFPVDGWTQHADGVDFEGCNGNAAAASNTYYGCTDICASFCSGIEYDTCSPYHLHYGKVIINQYTEKYTYVGPHKGAQIPTARKTTYTPPYLVSGVPVDPWSFGIYSGDPGDTGDKDYPYPAAPYEANAPSKIYILPCGSANTVQYPGIARCSWNPGFFGNRHVVFTDTGRTVQVCLRSKAILQPSYDQVQVEFIRTRCEVIGCGVPVSWNFPQFVNPTFADVVTGCEGCYAGENYPYVTGSVLIGTAGSGTYLAENGAIGHLHLEYKGYWRTAITTIYETVLVVSSEDRTVHTSIPISDSFTQARYPGWKNAAWTNADPVPAELHVDASLSCPENVWQIIPVRDKIIVLMDYRESFKNSPKPCLKCFTVAGNSLSMAGEYKNLISAEIVTDTYTSDISASWSPPVGGSVSYKIYDGDAKWYYHGKHNAGGQVIGSFTGDTPGPRMKVLWPSRAQKGGFTDSNGVEYAEGALIPGETIVLVSCECYEKKPYPPYDFKSRVEYRILKLTDAGLFEELFSGFDETDNHCLDTQKAWEVVKFSSEYPRPNTLVNMAVAGSFFEYMHQDKIDPTEWTIRRKA